MQLFKTKMLRRLAANCCKHQVQTSTLNHNGLAYSVQLIDIDLLLKFTEHTVKIWKVNLYKSSTTSEGMEFVDEIFHGKKLTAIGWFLFEESLLCEINALRLFDLPKANIRVIELNPPERLAA